VDLVAERVMFLVIHLLEELEFPGKEIMVEVLLHPTQRCLGQAAAGVEQVKLVKMHRA
jgi:hypothetical protein